MIFANSLDPSETPQNAVSHLDPNYLPHRSNFQKEKSNYLNFEHFKPTTNLADETFSVEKAIHTVYH